VATNKASPYDYEPSYHWYPLGGTVVFTPGFIPSESGYLIRLSYMAAHGEIADTGSVNARVDDNWLMWAAAVHCLRWKMQRTKNDDPVVAQMLNEAIAKEVEMRIKYPLPYIVRDPHFTDWGGPDV
jgi:hypothetical protein